MPVTGRSCSETRGGSGSGSSTRSPPFAHGSPTRVGWAGPGPFRPVGLPPGGSSRAGSHATTCTKPSRGSVRPCRTSTWAPTRRLSPCCGPWPSVWTGSWRASRWAVQAWIDHDHDPGGEILIGARWSPEFGFVVSVGPGGVGAERMADLTGPGGGELHLSPALHGSRDDHSALERTLTEWPLAPLVLGTARGREARLRSLRPGAGGIGHPDPSARGPRRVHAGAVRSLEDRGRGP